RIGSMPTNQIANVLGRILFPALSHVQEDKLKLKEYFLKSLNILSVSTSLLVILIFCLIPEFTALFLGAKWKEIVPLVRILILLGFVRILTSLIDYLFWSLGQ